MAKNTSKTSAPKAYIQAALAAKVSEDQEYLNGLQSAFKQAKDRDIALPARVCLESRAPSRNFTNEAMAADALCQMERALAFARMLPVNSKTLAIRAHIVAGIEAWHHA